MKTKILSILALLLMTVTQGAWAAETTETIATNNRQQSYSGTNVTITVTATGDSDGAQPPFTISTTNGENITQVVLTVGYYYYNAGNATASPGTCSVSGSGNGSTYITVTNINATSLTVSCSNLQIKQAVVTYGTPDPGTAVDLGLPSGKKWADRNVGAGSATGYGTYYAWSSSDIATAQWGTNWRMPTLTEAQELIDNTDQEWAAIGGVNGTKFMKKTDHSVYIFVPAAGWDGSGNGNIGTAGAYWTSTAQNESRAYEFVIRESGNATGNDNMTHQFTIRPVQMFAGEGTAVDLGLPSGTKWADMNVGAGSATGIGTYFEWGETTAYDNNNSYSGNNPTTLPLSNDAAYANWGSNWRMPTKAEYDELLNETYTTWTWNNDYNNTGVGGYLVTSKTNGNSIFLPKTGYYNNGSLGAQNRCDYWSSTINGSNNNEAYALGVGSGDRGTWNFSRSFGFPIRPVQMFVGEGTQASPYLISSTTDWNNLVSAVNAGETYSGNYFKMTANVGTVSTWMTGTFSGTFDGYGKTLTVGYSNTTADVKCAPFGTLNGATIQNLKVAGSISSNQRFIAGIAAWCSSTGNNVTNCLVSATINSSYSGNASDGGLVSLVDDGASLNVTGCAFAGKMLTTNGTTSCGGIVGWRRSSGTVTITNCLYAPTSATGSETWIASAEGENGNANFCRWNTSEPTITNCYYTTDFGSGDYTAQGLQARSISAGDYVSTLAISGDATATYDVSGITVYSTGISFNDGNTTTFYGGSGQSVSLALTAETRTGYQFKQYAASQGSLSGETTNTPTLIMPDANSTANDAVTISAEYDPLYNATFADGIDNNGWTISPSSATAGQTVTISYTGSRTITSVSAVKKPFGLSTFSFATPARGESSNLTFTGASTEKPVWFIGTVETHNTTGTVVYNHSAGGSDDYLSFNGIQFFSGWWSDVPGALYITGGLGTKEDPFVLSTTSSPAPDMELTVTPNGEKSWTITMPTSDVEIQVLMPYTVTFGDDNSTLTEASGGAGVSLPSRSVIGSYTFAGWSETNETEETTTAPTIIATGEYHPTSDITLYPVYTRTEGSVSDVVDVLNLALTGASGTTYSNWSGKTATSSAVYAGNSAGGNNAIQLRSNNNNSGIVTTTSGGKVKKVSISWNSNTNSARKVDVYGKNSAYSAASDLYNESTQGTKLGTIQYSTSKVDLTIAGDYEYIGLRSNDGALYLSEVEITWSSGSFTNYYTSLPRVSLSYTVTFGDDNDNDGWEIDPMQQIAGGTVTVSYTGENKVKSVTVAPKGALTGKFSVSSTKQVQFSKGNLQYVGTWQFAANQYDIFGGSQSDDHRDLFGWGTKTNPNNTSTTNGDYSWAEWGENTITNGCTGWRTLTKDEWGYLFTNRANASTLRTFATVNNVEGLIVMPDGWTASGVTLTITTENYTTNVLSTSQWATLEKQGCVFLPAAGGRAGTNVVNVGSIGDYWSSDESGETNAYDLNFSNNYLLPQNTAGQRHYGWSVRLVRDVE